MTPRRAAAPAPAGIFRERDHSYWLDGQGPFPGVTRITALQEAIGGSDGLLDWAVGVALDTALTVYDGTDDRDRAIAAGHARRNAARDLGTAVHAVVESINRGDQVTSTPETAPYAAQYAGFLVRHRVDILAAEGLVAHRTFKYGGTFDLLARIAGRTALVDVKTGKSRPAHRLQLAAYGMAEAYGEQGQPASAMPEIQDYYVLLLRPDSFDLVSYEVTDADRAHFVELARLYHMAATWRKKEHAA